FGQEQEDGGLLARLILSAEHLPRKRLAGRVSQVRIEDNSFTLDLRNGAEIEVLVDENTGFHSRDGNIQRIEDLKEGMVAIIVFQPQINGERLAVNVFASEAENLPRFDLRINGEITGIGDNSIEVKTKLGGLYTFAFGSETRVFDRDWKEYEVNSLEVGMQIKLGGIKLDDGSILAKLILIPSQK
ncbi:MAG TPA: hypothetical protein G4N95_06990, partial [Anaerolineae bacterium]|nr:hypothetical protein [Anaerolineae bacterium]